MRSVDVKGIVLRSETATRLRAWGTKKSKLHMHFEARSILYKTIWKSRYYEKSKSRCPDMSIKICQRILDLIKYCQNNQVIQANQWGQQNYVYKVVTAVIFKLNSHLGAIF